MPAGLELAYARVEVERLGRTLRDTMTAPPTLAWCVRLALFEAAHRRLEQLQTREISR